MTKSNSLDLGSYTIDPKSDEFKALAALAKPGDGFNCLIGIYGQAHVGKWVYGQHTADEKEIRVTHNGIRWARQMTVEEEALARGFDLGELPKKKVRVTFNLTDGRWFAKRAAGNGTSNNKSPDKPKGRNAAKKQSNRALYRDALLAMKVEA